MLTHDVSTLVKQAKEGDTHAFELLYKEYYPRIFRYCRINVVYDELTKDLCQETFVKAWRSLKTFSIFKNGSFQAYLFKIARNLIIDLSRKKKEFSLDTLTLVASPESLEKKLEITHSQQTLKKALASLVETERQIVILRYFENLSHNEIAHIMGVKDGAIRVRMMRILRKLRRILKHE